MDRIYVAELSSIVATSYRLQRLGQSPCCLLYVTYVRARWKERTITPVPPLYLVCTVSYFGQYLRCPRIMHVSSSMPPPRLRVHTVPGYKVGTCTAPDPCC